MLPDSVIPKKELKEIMKRFNADKDRGIGMKMFCDVAGISTASFKSIFVDEEQELSEYIQRRVSKAYKSWMNGEIAVMMNRNQTRFAQYRKEPKPRMVRDTRIAFENGQFKLNVGVRNSADYSITPLDEQMRRR